MSEHDDDDFLQDAASLGRRISPDTGAALRKVTGAGATRQPRRSHVHRMLAGSRGVAVAAATLAILGGALAASLYARQSAPSSRASASPPVPVGSPPATFPAASALPTGASATSTASPTATTPPTTAQPTPAPTPAGLTADLVPAGSFVFPQQAAVDSAGNVWFTSVQPGSKVVGRVAPDHTVARFTPPSQGMPYAIAAAPDGAVWFTEIPGSGSTAHLGRIAPDGTIREFAGPPPAQPVTPNTLDLLTGIVVSADGTVWFSEGQRNKIGRLTPNGTFSEFAVPGAACCSRSPLDLRMGSDGGMWFHLGEPDTLNIGTAAPYVSSTGPVTGVGRITTTGAVTVYSIPEASGVGAYVAGPGGTRWARLSSGSVRCVTGAGGVVDSPADAGPGPTFPYLRLILGPDGAAWWIGSANHLVRMDSACHVTRYDVRGTGASAAFQDLVTVSRNRIALADTGGGDIALVTVPVAGTP